MPKKAGANVDIKNEDAVFKYLTDLEKEGNYREIIEFIVDTTEKQAMGEDVVSAVDASIRWQESWTEKNDRNAIIIKPDKMDDYLKFAEEVGKYQAELQIKLGKEKKEFAGKIKNGEIKGAEEVMEDDEAIAALTDAYIDKYSETRSKCDIISMAFQMFNTDPLKFYRDKFNEKTAEAVHDYASKNSGMTENDAHKTLVLGVNRGKNKALEYGFAVNPDKKNPEDPYFIKNDGINKKPLLNELDKNDLDKLEKKAVEQGRKYSELMVTLKDAVYEAGLMLKELEGMKKAGHKNSDEYNEMHDALLKFTKLDEYNQPATFGKVLEELKEASENFKNTHSSFFRARWGYGNDRRNMSMKLQKFAGDLTENIEAAGKDIKLTTPIKLAIDNCSEKAAAIDNQKKKFLTNHKDIKISEGIKENNKVTSQIKVKANDTLTHELG